MNSKIRLHRGDITKLPVDAIVNAANEECLGKFPSQIINLFAIISMTAGGGVDGAISKAAGPHLLDERRLLGGVKTGHAKATFSYRLPSTYIIHAVGPRGENPGLLASAYNASLQIAHDMRFVSIAFPCISTGIFRYPSDAAADVETHPDTTVHRTHCLHMQIYLFFTTSQIESVILVIVQPADYNAYVSKALPRYFPC